ncbi:MAG: crossover junction endodeoxyribonuclease RuvC [Bryobacteraceae bacterium]
MRVLGIDCGSERTGYGVVDSDGHTHKLVICGVIKTLAKSPLEQRLVIIGREIRSVLALYQPQAAAVEDLFYAANVKSVLKLAHVRGVALLLLAEAGLDVVAYSPAEVKMAVVGYGRAEKGQVQLMVRSLLKLDAVIESEDASDAVAVAICHAARAARHSGPVRVGASS